jgi:two-component system sensor histidine kinase RegB
MITERLKKEIIQPEEQQDDFTRQAPYEIAFSWLLLLRWGTVACQVLLIAVAFLFLKINIPLAIVSAIILFEGGSNYYFQYRHKRRTAINETLFGLVMFLDIILLSALLYYTGGPMNPFTFLYLVHIVLGAVLMRPAWSWGLTIFTIICYAGLFFPEVGDTSYPDLVEQTQEICHEAVLGQTEILSGSMQLHLQGMWVAFAISSFFIVFFVSRIRQALEQHQLTSVYLREAQMNNERLASLATLAAGAAHEFSTPLSTIAVAAGEMSYSIKSLPESDEQKELYDDAMLIRSEVDKCKEILFQMAADAGEHMGENFIRVQLDTFVENLLVAFENEYGCQVRWINEVGDAQLLIPVRTLHRSIKGLLKNGLDASAGSEPDIQLKCSREQDTLILEVADKGEGMTPEAVARATDPFYTSKAPGKGLGLGLYLARSVAERLGGLLTIASEQGRGTQVYLQLTGVFVDQDES